MDSSGRKNPVPIPGTEQILELDTLIVTIGDTPDVGYISYMDIKVNKWGTLIINDHTLETNRKGVFAGGDVVTGPNTVIAAIADGKKVALMIDRYMNNEILDQPLERKIPKVYVEPVEAAETESDELPPRVKLPTISATRRKETLEEVELTLSEADAKYEALRCMRCDLEFTYQKNKEREQQDIQEEIESKGGVLV